MAQLRSCTKCYEKEIGRRIIMGVYMFVGGLALFVLGMEFMTKRHMFILKIGATGPYRAANIRMFTWMVYICAETGAESMKMWPFW